MSNNAASVAAMPIRTLHGRRKGLPPSCKFRKRQPSVCPPARRPPMLYLLLLVATAIIGFICQARRHFGRQIPAYRVDEVIGKLQVRRYPTLPVAEIRVSGSSAIVALHAGTKLLNRYFREHQISRFALPLFAEKVDAADAVWTMSAVLPMPLSAAPAPRNKAIQLREVPPQRVFARRYHGSVSADERLTQHKAELLPEVNDACRRLGCTKLSTVVVMHIYPIWFPSLFRISDLMVRVTDEGSAV